MTTSYKDRRLDLLVFHDQGKGVPLSLSLDGDTSHGLAVTGIAKLAQRFFLELMTVRGTIRGLPNRGCDFLSDGWQGMWQTPADVKASFAAASNMVSTNLLTDEREDDPDDEKLEEVELVEATTSEDSMSIHIHMTTKAGESRVVLMPLPLTAITRGEV